ncbi:MAG TPA: hypothetical protein VFM27_02210 [Acidimicrobiales bacterium]|nr:hypothetical protein [Acidimicrobiales bacterium]
MRVTAALACAVGLVVALAAPAAAKGPTGLTVTYPGGGEVDVDLTQGGTEEDRAGPGSLVEDMGLWTVLGSGAGVPVLAASPPDGLAEDGLGPRYTVTWTMYDGQDGFELVQYLYPDAPGGAVVHSPGGQPAEPYAPVTAGGWLRATGDPAARLAALGVDLGVDLDAPRPAPAPDLAPAPDPARAAAPDPAPDRAGGGPGVAVPLAALAAVAAAAGVAAAVRIRGRRAAPAAG